MATFLFLVQLLFLGTLIIPARAQNEKRCELIKNATSTNITILVKPETYQANTTYQVTINDSRNLTGSPKVTGYLLQALGQQNESIGTWKEPTVNCSDVSTAVLNATQNETIWTSSNHTIGHVEIRAFVILNETMAMYNSITLRKASNTTTAPPTTTPNSVSTAQSSSFFIAASQLLLLLLTSKLLS